MHLRLKNLRILFCKCCSSIHKHSKYGTQVFCPSQVWAHWMVLAVGGSKGRACHFVQCMMGAGSRSALSRPRSKPLGSSSTLEGAPWGSTTLSPRSTSPHCLPASTLLECSRLWAWARASWGCAPAFLLLPTSSSVKTQPTGGLAGLVEAGGAGRFHSSRCGKWFRSLRSWLCQTQTQAWCPHLDRPAPPWCRFQIWGFQGCFPLGKQDRKLGLNKNFWVLLLNGNIHGPTHPQYLRGFWSLSVIWKANFSSWRTFGCLFPLSAWPRTSNWLSPQDTVLFLN